MKPASLALILSLACVNGAGSASAEDGLAYRAELAAHQALARIRAEVPFPNPFETDGCSGGLSASWRLASGLFTPFEEVHGATPPWEACCVTHDRAYHRAGRGGDAADSYQDRLIADEALRLCVIDTADDRLASLADAYGVSPEDVTDGYALIASAMFRAVRLGGLPCSGLPWRWGYGFDHCIVTQQDFAGPTPETKDR